MRDVNKYIDYDMYMMLLLLCRRRLFNNFQIFAEFFLGRTRRTQFSTTRWLISNWTAIFVAKNDFGRRLLIFLRLAESTGDRSQPVGARVSALSNRAACEVDRQGWARAGVHWGESESEYEYKYVYVYTYVSLGISFVYDFILNSFRMLFLSNANQHMHKWVTTYRILILCAWSSCRPASSSGLFLCLLGARD